MFISCWFSHLEFQRWINLRGFNNRVATIVLYLRSNLHITILDHTTHFLSTNLSSVLLFAYYNYEVCNMTFFNLSMICHIIEVTKSMFVCDWYFGICKEPWGMLRACLFNTSVLSYLCIFIFVYNMMFIIEIGHFFFLIVRHLRSNFILGRVWHSDNMTLSCATICVLLKEESITS
jgi:hypothetical protein